MSARNRLAHRFLDLAAKRWPAGIRDEMAQEWHAELAAIQAEPGGTREGLAYAFSLLASPPFRDGSGAPRGWGETTPPMAPAFAVVFAGMLTLGVTMLAGSLVGYLTPLLGYETYGGSWSSTLLGGVLVAVWCVLAGHRLGRRLPIGQTKRFGTATAAAFAPLLLTPALLTQAVIGQDPLYVVAVLAGLAIWVPGLAVLGVAAVRGRLRWTLLAGVPLVSVAAAAVAGVPQMLTSTTPGAVFIASMLSGEPPSEFTVMPDGELSSRSFYWMGPWAVTLAVFGVLALAYGLGARRPAPAVVTVPRPENEQVAPPAGILSVAGALVVALGVAGWAYTLAVLSPAMPGVSAVAPMPGGDGEIYLWVAELRWGAILLAAVGMLAAAADRWRAGISAVVLTVLLVLADGVLVRAGVSGGGGLRLALLTAAVATVAAWFAAGRRLKTGGRRDAAVRRRVAAAAVIGAVCAPQLLFQGTPGVNHPYLPAGLVWTTTGLAALGVVLASVAAVTLSRRRLPVGVAVLVLVVPVVAVAVAGLSPVPAASEDNGSALWGATVGLPLAVLTIGLLRRHRARPRGRTAALWVLMAAAGAPATIALWLGSAFFLSMVPDLLFAIEGLGYPADGISVVPGAALLVTPFAALVAARLGGAVASTDVVPASTVEAAATT
ncbi:hypothetical protein ACTI_61030 [Actinoplanes sp. OR16]|uniref:hypothetical protein n=1 Tax=Actinoplanes sp. OR16 TaxID=946334 RepID=UPI000F70C7C0|nr:hypothetical protein [Actinoplanes sp. OR16]BBH69418.1 hypothetical protein ACTI_61030 [Actinoplanes sp. OR16]